MGKQFHGWRSDFPIYWYLVFLIWLESGYTVSLEVGSDLSLGSALWQAALCVVAIVPLLLIVIEIITIPKELAKLPKAVLIVLWPIVGLCQFILPWLGWSALIWFLNKRTLTWPAALQSASGVALFSYLTGLGLMIRFKPRARDVELTRADVSIPGLPKEFDGYQILHISDIHGGAFASMEEVGHRLRTASALRPDVIAFTGDLSHSSPGSSEAVARMLAGLSAPDGIVAVLGNHDIWIGEAYVAAALGSQGVKVLMNEHLSVSRDGAQLYLAGINDISYTSRGHLEDAIAGIPESAPIILLSHAPVVVRDALAERASLVLSGHTHGGQIVLPLIGPVYVSSRLGRRYASGLHSIGELSLYINRGLGEVFPPMRINCPPELALVTLRPAPAD